MATKIPTAGAEDFQTLMDRRLDAVSPADIAAIDAEIRTKFERRMGIMITDMSGMTELTKSRGILEILALVRRMQRIADPVIKEHGGLLVKTEADDLFVVHDSAKSLYALAFGLLEAAKKHNQARGTNELLIAIGLGFGPVLFLGGEIWGDAVNVASKLGEDTAAGGEILISEDFHAALLAEGVTPKASLIPESHRKAKFPYYSCT
jgi:adenylate cyclase